MKVSLARYGKPSSTATLQASPLLGETDGVWAVTTYHEKGLEPPFQPGKSLRTIAPKSRSERPGNRSYPSASSSLVACRTEA